MQDINSCIRMISRRGASLLASAFFVRFVAAFPSARPLSHHRFFHATRPSLMPRGVKKENLPSKDCVVCGRPFTWRKKVCVTADPDSQGRLATRFNPHDYLHTLTITRCCCTASTATHATLWTHG